MSLQRIFPRPRYFPDKDFQSRLAASGGFHRIRIALWVCVHRKMNCPTEPAKRNRAKVFRNCRLLAIRDVQCPFKRKADAVIVAAVKKPFTAFDVLLKHARARALESKLPRDV